MNKRKEKIEEALNGLRDIWEDEDGKIAFAIVFLLAWFAIWVIGQILYLIITYPY